MQLLDWVAPGPYRVAFSTRIGGVSAGPFASLNIGLSTGDEPDSVIENRRRLCAAVGADPEIATMAWQQHGSHVARAAATGILSSTNRFEQCDGLWTDVPGLAVGLITADCLPIALCRADGAPALCVLHAGWKGLLAGIVGSGSRDARNRARRGRDRSRVSDRVATRSAKRLQGPSAPRSVTT